MSAPELERVPAREPLRVIHVSSGNLFGGVETFLLELAKHAWPGGSMAAHFAVTAEGRLSAGLEALDVPVHRLGPVRFRDPLRIAAARKTLGHVLREHPFDVAVCHSAWAHALFAGPVRKAAIPLVFYLHGHVTGRHWIERIARRSPPDLVITNSRFTGATAANLFPGVPVEVVYHPVARPAESTEADRSRVRAELGTPSDDVVIVQTSRLEPWKGHRLHLDALERLENLPGWTCWMVGGAQRPHERPYLEELRGRAQAAGIADRVRFTGERSDVPRLLAAADIHCQPNTGPEPFGIAFVEALHAGLPVVSTDLGGAREIVDDSCGILVPPGDGGALAAALRELITDPERRKALGRGGPPRADGLCRAERQIEQLATALSAVVLETDRSAGTA